MAIPTQENRFFEGKGLTEILANAQGQASYVSGKLTRVADVQERFRVETLLGARFHAERLIEAIDAALKVAR